jgi:hypothetical protein
VSWRNAPHIPLCQRCTSVCFSLSLSAIPLPFVAGSTLCPHCGLHNPSMWSCPNALTSSELTRLVMSSVASTAKSCPALSKSWMSMSSDSAQCAAHGQGDAEIDRPFLIASHASDQREAGLGNPLKTSGERNCDEWAFSRANSRRCRNQPLPFNSIDPFTRPRARTAGRHRLYVDSRSIQSVHPIQRLRDRVGSAVASD